MQATVNRKDREKASAAEAVPLDSAVNMLLAKTFSPTKSSAMEHRRFPVTARE